MTIDPVQALIASGLGTLALAILTWAWRYVTNGIQANSKEIAEHKLHVAERYTSKTDMAAFDLKITSQLVRIEAKLDQQISKH